MGTVFWVIVGMFVAWNFPQPQYAKNFQNYVMEKWKEFRNNKNDSSV